MAPDGRVVLTKDLLRVSRAGGGYHPQFTDPDEEALAGRVLGVYQGHVGERRADLEASLTDLEREVEDFKLVRGFAKLLEREATFETRAPLKPQRARTAAFEAAESVGGVASEGDREAALSAAADRVGATPDDVEASLFADRDDEQALVALETDHDPESLREQYDLSLAQTASNSAVWASERSYCATSSAGDHRGSNSRSTCRSSRSAYSAASTSSGDAPRSVAARSSALVRSSSVTTPTASPASNAARRVRPGSSGALVSNSASRSSSLANPLTSLKSSLSRSRSRSASSRAPRSSPTWPW